MTLANWLATQPNRCPSCGFDLKRQSCRCGGTEWDIFVRALRATADATGLIHQTDMRPLIQRIPPKSIGLFYRQARVAGLIEAVGKEPSTDAAGRNQDKEQRIYRLKAAAA